MKIGDSTVMIMCWAGRSRSIVGVSGGKRGPQIPGRVEGITHQGIHMRRASCEEAVVAVYEAMVVQVDEKVVML